MENQPKRINASGVKSTLNNEEDTKKTVFICDYCQNEFSSSYYLKRHVPVHTGQKDHHCHLCDFSASQKGNLEVHIRRHLNERNFKCPEPNCGASFVTSTGLKLHQQSIHKKLKKLLCSSCPYKTNSKYHLTQHLKNIHSDLKPFKCPHPNCEYSAKQQSNLKQHMEIHSLDKNQICPHPNCEYKTKTSSDFKSHIKIHSNGEKRYKCHFCDFSSHHQKSMVVHVRRHTGETPFACQLCSYKSKQKPNLKRHMKIHAH